MLFSRLIWVQKSSQRTWHLPISTCWYRTTSDVWSMWSMQFSADVVLTNFRLTLGLIWKTDSTWLLSFVFGAMNEKWRFSKSFIDFSLCLTMPRYLAMPRTFLPCPTQYESRNVVLSNGVDSSEQRMKIQPRASDGNFWLLTLPMISRATLILMGVKLSSMFGQGFEKRTLPAIEWLSRSSTEQSSRKGLPVKLKSDISRAVVSLLELLKSLFNFELFNWVWSWQDSCD